MENKVTHYSFTIGTSSAPGRTYRGNLPSSFADDLADAIDHINREAQRGEMAYADFRFYDSEPFLQFTIYISAIPKGHYPVTGYAIPVDDGRLKVSASEIDFDHPDFSRFWQQACEAAPKGSHIVMLRIRRPDVVEVK